MYSRTPVGRTANPARGAKFRLAGDRAQGLGESVGERRDRPPAQLALGERGVERAAGELAQARRPVLGSDVGAGGPLALGEQLEDARLGRGADVEGRVRTGVLEGGQVGRDDVADV